MRNKNVWCFLFAGLFFLFGLQSVSLANFPIVDFDDDTVYDVYVQVTDQDMLIIERVEIKGIKTLNDQNFLVVFRNDGIFAKEKESFVLFDTIRVILPSYYKPSKTIWRSQSSD